MSSAFHQLCPRYNETLTPTAPTANRPWETFTFYIQHTLCLSIDSEITHKRFFSYIYKIFFINKGFKFVDLPCTLTDRPVADLLPAYSNDKEPPITCYKYNKSRRLAIFNFNKLEINDINANTPIHETGKITNLCIRHKI